MDLLIRFLVGGVVVMVFALIGDVVYAATEARSMIVGAVISHAVALDHRLPKIYQELSEQRHQ